MNYPSHVELQKDGIVISFVNVKCMLRNVDEIKLLIQEEKIYIFEVIESNLENNVIDYLLPLMSVK